MILADCLHDNTLLGVNVVETIGYEIWHWRGATFQGGVGFAQGSFESTEGFYSGNGSVDEHCRRTPCCHIDLEVLFDEGRCVVSQTLFHRGSVYTHLRRAFVCFGWIWIASVHAKEPWDKLVLSWKLRLYIRILGDFDYAHRGLLQEARRCLIKAFHIIGSPINEWVQRELNFRAEVSVKLLQYSDTKIFAAMSFVAKEQCQLHNRLRGCQEQGNLYESSHHRSFN